jgi:hypothetical protein
VEDIDANARPARITRQRAVCRDRDGERVRRGDERLPRQHHHERAMAGEQEQDGAAPRERRRCDRQSVHRRCAAEAEQRALVERERPLHGDEQSDQSDGGRHRVRAERARTEPAVRHDRRPCGECPAQQEAHERVRRLKRTKELARALGAPARRASRKLAVRRVAHAEVERLERQRHRRREREQRVPLRSEHREEHRDARELHEGAPPRAREVDE